MKHHILETEQKALEINLDERIYGAFAEIGAGQEVARYFFQVGAAAGTIAKSMSAYDKTVSDEIYGVEEKGKGRYVCEHRLYQMLDHEYGLMENRLRSERPQENFFAFADTVAAINFQKTIKGDGWLGLRFQLKPWHKPNDLVLHVRLLDQDNRLQQQAVGILGVNMIYACFRYAQEPEMLIRSLMDKLRNRVQIDMVRLEGPDFEQIDNRLVCLWTVKNGLSDIAIFNPQGRAVHAGEFLYKKSVLIARGSYRPPTLVQQDMTKCAYSQFTKDASDPSDQVFFLTEIALENLIAHGHLDERDFLDRATLLCTLGQTVVISNFSQHKQLIAYFSEYRIPRIGIAMGVRKLQRIVTETCRNNPRNLLGAFGEIFLQNVRFYIYPALVLPEESGDENGLMNARNLEVSPAIRFLYQYLLDNKNIIDIEGFNPQVLNIHHKEVLHQIREGLPGWEALVPIEVAAFIKENRLFMQ
ncbi:MAG: TonB-dependent receptor [Saprospiraceae bacterium]|nr:TonB-dependent receptor [Saprospiraceae bacterium]